MFAITSITRTDETLGQHAWFRKTHWLRTRHGIAALVLSGQILRWVTACNLPRWQSRECQYVHGGVEILMIILLGATQGPFKTGNPGAGWPMNDKRFSNKVLGGVAGHTVQGTKVQYNVEHGHRGGATHDEDGNMYLLVEEGSEGTTGRSVGVVIVIFIK